MLAMLDSDRGPLFICSSDPIIYLSVTFLTSKCLTISRLLTQKLKYSYYAIQGDL